MLDFPTLLVGYCTTTLILSLALLLAARSQKRFPGLELWSLGGLLIGTVPLQLAAHRETFLPWDLLAVTLAIIGGMACLSAGMARYTAGRFRIRLYATIAGAWTIFACAAAWFRPPLEYGVALLAMLVGVMAAETGMHLIRQKHFLEMPAHRVTAGLFLLLALGAGGRVVMVLVLGLGGPRFGAAVLHPLGLLGFQALHTAIGMCLLVMVWARLDRELHAHVGTLEEQVGCDPLTGALNRRGLRDCVEPLLASASRYAHPLSVICLDIDHFKRVNDEHGHAVGDEVLKALVGGIRQHLRASDHLARLGGEEFAVILPGTGLEGAAALAERLRAAVEVSPVRQGEVVVSYTCSFGAAARLPHEDSLAALLARADHALYDAKRGGRNQVRCAAIRQGGALPGGVRD